MLVHFYKYSYCEFYSFLTLIYFFQGGTVTCSQVSCPPATCSKTLVVPGQCCPVCDVCIDTDLTQYSHGQSWQPRNDPCSTCTCAVSKLCSECCFIWPVVEYAGFHRVTIWVHLFLINYFSKTLIGQSCPLCYVFYRHRFDTVQP